MKRVKGWGFNCEVWFVKRFKVQFIIVHLQDYLTDFISENLTGVISGNLTRVQRWSLTDYQREYKMGNKQAIQGKYSINFNIKNGAGFTRGEKSLWTLRSLRL